VFDFNEDPGEGNLNVRAYVAALVGPLRTAHGNRQVKQVSITRGTELARNGAANNVPMYVEVWPPMQIKVNGVWVLFSASEQTGETGRSVLLTAIPGQVQDRYQAILLANEQLYAQAVSDGAGAPLGGPVPLVVSTVSF
jgi:hypothetical protein